MEEFGRQNVRKELARATIFDSGEVCMAARQVILYFDDQKDALRFALAAGSVMAGEGGTVTTEERALIQETQRASRILPHRIPSTRE